MTRTIPRPAPTGAKGLRTLLLALPLLGALACAGGEVPAERPPSILFITVDTLRADHLGCYGYGRETSPNIDRLAQEGVLFESTIAQAPWTLPSMASLMTGRYVFGKVGRMPEGHPTLGSLLKERGYATGAFVANNALGVEEGFHAGFDRYDAAPELATVSVDPRAALRRAGEVLTHRALSWVRSQQQRPFLLYIHYIDPHGPYGPPAEAVHFDAESRPDDPARQRRYERAIERDPRIAARADGDRTEIESVIDLYDADVRYTDACIGRLLDGFRELGLLDETLVVLTSDHGEGLYEHERYEGLVKTKVPEEQRSLLNVFLLKHSETVYQELVRVPLIFRGPGLRAGHRVPSTVGNVDVLPTILDLTGDLVAEAHEGRSLRPVLEDPAGKLPEAEVYFTYSEAATAVYDPASGLKYVRPNALGQRLGLVPALFDLAADPGEDHNLIEEGEASALARAATLDRRVRDAMADHGRRLEESPFAPETLEKLRALGYTE